MIVGAQTAQSHVAHSVGLPTVWPHWVRDAFRREPRFAASVLVTVIMSVPVLIAFALDARTFQGTSVWLKPMKFHLAASVFLATLTWIAGWLPDRMKDTRRYAAYSSLVAFSSAAEIVWVDSAAWLGTASHYNVTNPILAALYPIMGLLAVMLTSPALVYGMALARWNDALLETTFRWSLVSGLLVTFFATVFVAGTLASYTSHTIAPAGDLRTAHFLATHALHVIPVGGWFFGRWVGGRFGAMGALLIVLLYVGLIASAYTQALAGQPFGIGWPL
jgi:hypothetical protein